MPDKDEMALHHDHPQLCLELFVLSSLFYTRLDSCLAAPRGLAPDSWALWFFFSAPSDEDIGLLEKLAGRETEKA